MGSYKKMTVAAFVLAGFFLDCVFGDPAYSFHPVRIMGSIISAGEKLLLKKKRGKAPSFIFGAVFSLFLVCLVYFFYFAALVFLYKIHFICGIIAETGFCYQIFAAKALKDESMKVYDELKKGDIPQARVQLSYIVGRDTENLNEEAVSKAAIETIAENLSDGVIAPMLYMFIGGAPLGFMYKAVNTLDSMIGYKNEKYEYFGKFAARADDILNFLPSRISAVLMILASVICKLNAGQAWKIFLRDRYNHKSPNSAQTESVCAGALGVSLSGDNYYHGILVKKPTIGDPLRPVLKEDIKTANKLMYISSFIGLAAGILIRILLYVYL
jgi:adenosylcobinamide-phosphate synthase